MEQLIAEQSKNWLQLYVDAMTEKDPYKRLALVRQLRQVPRHDESDDSPERPRVQMATKQVSPRPMQSPRPAQSPKRAQVTISSSRKAKPEQTRMHLVRSRAPKAHKTSGRGPRLRSA
jgi:hypothetical protein